MPVLLRRALFCILFIAAYVALDRASLIQQFLPLEITPWNPASGMVLALLLVLGAKIAPLMALAALIAELAVRDLPSPLVPTLFACVAIAIIYACLAKALLKLKLDRRFNRLRDVFLLLAASVVAAGVAAFIYVGAYAVWGLIPDALFWRAVGRYWIGDMIGIVVMTPLTLLVIAGWPFKRPSHKVMGEGLVQILALMGALWIIFFPRETDEFRLFYLLFLPLLWMAVRFGLMGAVLGNMAAQGFMVIAFQIGGHASTTVTAYQILLLVLSGATLVTGAAIGERRRVEAILHARQDEVAQLARLSMAGEMAAALAHELNQPLMAAIAFTRASQRMLTSDQPDLQKAAGAMDRAVSETQRAGEIIRTLREFIGKAPEPGERHNISTILRDAIALAAPECTRRRIKLELQVPRAPLMVVADRVRLQQVLLNLVRNAMDSLEQEGEIIVSGIARIDGVEVRVTDNGTGVPDEIAKRLFDPFVTTKTQGMGLGLSISRSFVEDHGGRLWLEKNDANGATFCFHLPALPLGE